MSILPHQELLRLIEAGVIDSRPEHVGPSSIDLHLADDFWTEAAAWAQVVRPGLGRGPEMRYSEGVAKLAPGAFCLASTRERVTMPYDLTAVVYLRSTAARCGLDHALAVYIDPGFVGAITLELRNSLAVHPMWLYAGDRLAQIVFHRHEPTDAPYRGFYQGDSGTQQAKAH